MNFRNSAAPLANLLATHRRAPQTSTSFSRPNHVRACVQGLAGCSVLLAPRLVLACAACYGQSDSAMAAGMNWGILSLLGMIVFVLGGVAGFFVFLARRSMKLAAAAAAAGSHSPGTGGEAAGFAEDSVHLDIPPLAARGGLGQVSALARRRSQCTHHSPRTRH